MTDFIFKLSETGSMEIKLVHHRVIYDFLKRYSVFIHVLDEPCRKLKPRTADALHVMEPWKLGAYVTQTQNKSAV